MSLKHLSAGSLSPSRVEGLLRLFSNVYCPYAQRSRLILKLKKIPHDIVNINLVRRPEWYFSIHSKGKVPTLLDGSKIVIESLDISDYLDEKFPTIPLYPTEPAAKAKEKELVQKTESVVRTFNNCVILGKADAKTPEEWLKSFLEELDIFEKTLENRGTTYFGGDKPGMVDYMLWPWAERAPSVDMALGQKLPIRDDQLPFLRKWRKSMMDDPVCSELYIPPKQFWRIVEHKLKGVEPPFDEEF